MINGLFIIDKANLDCMAKTLRPDLTHLRINYDMLFDCLPINLNKCKKWLVSNHPISKKRILHKCLTKIGFNFTRYSPLKGSDDAKIIQLLENCCLDFLEIFLLSGDKHFYPALKSLAQKNRQITVIAIPQNTSWIMRRDFNFFDLTQFKNKFIEFDPIKDLRSIKS